MNKHSRKEQHITQRDCAKELPAKKDILTTTHFFIILESSLYYIQLKLTTFRINSVRKKQLTDTKFMHKNSNKSYNWVENVN